MGRFEDSLFWPFLIIEFTISSHPVPLRCENGTLLKTVILRAIYMSNYDESSSPGCVATQTSPMIPLNKR